LAALAASQCYLDSHPKGNVIVISPASLTKNFAKEMVKYGGKLSSKYKFYSFDTFMNLNKDDKVDCSKSMIIIDEAHNMRNANKRFESAFKCVQNSDKLILLTATPYINRLYDFVPLIQMLYRDEDIMRKTKNNFSKNISIKHEDFEDALKKLYNLLRGKVSYHGLKTTSDFPTVNYHRLDPNMTAEYFKKYDQSINEDMDFGLNPQVFYHGFRRAVNTVGSRSEEVEIDDELNKKLDIVLDLILTENNQTLVFTNWIDAGVKVLTHLFRQYGIAYLIIEGDTPPKDRLDIVEKYNDGEAQVLIITQAGTEGLDLKGTRNIILLDPVWSNAVVQQIIGRGVRYLSHAHLPEEERVVDVYQLMTKSGSKDLPSGDEVLYGIVDRKKTEEAFVYEMLSNASIYLEAKSLPKTKPTTKLSPKSRPKPKIELHDYEQTEDDTYNLDDTYPLFFTRSKTPPKTPPAPELPIIGEGFIFDNGTLRIENRGIDDQEFESIINQIGRENINELTCSGCKKITRITNLPRVHRIYCSGCENLEIITEVPILMRLHCLYSPKLEKYIEAIPSTKDFRKIFPMLVECECCSKFKDDMMF